MVGFLPDDLENYISAHSESGGDVEKALRKETLDLGPSSGMMSLSWQYFKIYCQNKQVQKDIGDWNIYRI